MIEKTSLIDPELVATLARYTISGLIAAFGGVVGVAVNVMQKKMDFKWSTAFVFIITAFLVGQVIEDWMPPDLPGKGGILLIAGTAALPVLSLLQSKVNALLEKLK